MVALNQRPDDIGFGSSVELAQWEAVRFGLESRRLGHGGTCNVLQLFADSPQASLRAALLQLCHPLPQGFDGHAQFVVGLATSGAFFAQGLRSKQDVL